MTGRRHARGIIGVLALAAAASACGGGGSSQATIRPVGPTTISQLAAAGAAVRAQRSASFSLTEHLSLAGRSEDIGGTGGFDYTSGDGTVQISVAGQQVSTVITPTLIYEMLPAAGRGGSATPWISVPVSAVLSTAGQSQLAAGDPSQALNQLSSLTNVTAVGSDTIRGVHTTHYTATADPSKSLANLAPSLRATVQSAIGGIATVPVDIWLDDQGLPRRFRSTITTTTQGTSVTATSTYELFDYGKPVTVTVPPAGQVTARTSLTPS